MKMIDAGSAYGWSTTLKVTKMNCIVQIPALLKQGKAVVDFCQIIGKQVWVYCSVEDNCGYR